MRSLCTAVVLAATFCATGAAKAADCSDVTIAEMKWASAGIAANLDKIILETGYGCSVTIVPGDTLPTFKSMKDEGQPDIASEFWINADRVELDNAIKDGRLVQGAEILSEGAVEGWWIPKFVADANPGIRTVQDALKHPELFPIDKGSSEGVVHSCPIGWSCRISTENLFRALGADKNNFRLIESSSPQSLDDSIAKAFSDKIGWLGYYWAPTAMLGKYDMTRLSFGVAHDKAEWDNCTSVPDCARPQVNSYPVSRAYTLVTKAFADRAGAATDYLKRRSWDNTTINDVLAWQDEQNKSNHAAAIYFLKNYIALWSKWVPADVAEKIESSL